ncbi:MAG TPA: ADOP family duplicated permease [Terriglobales bacterium]|nr:ADOP family duplicated permease [Terriglobales bacterium]
MLPHWGRRGRKERDLEDELEFHLRQSALREGSRRRAEALLGGSDAIKEECRAERRWAAAAGFGRDLCLGWRLLRRSPGFAVAAIVTLALAIGANTAAYSMLAPLLELRSPFRDADRIAQLVSVNENGRKLWGNPFWSGDFAVYRAHASAFSELSGWSVRSANLSGAGSAAHVSVMQVTRGFFSIWGVAAAQGRTFMPNESATDRAREIVLSNHLWRGPLGARPMVGRQIRLDGAAYTVVGIMPAAWARNVIDVDCWIPLTLSPAQLAAHTRATVVPLDVAGRLRPGATMAEAQQQILALAQQRAERHAPDRPCNHCVAVVPIDEMVQLESGNSVAAFALLMATTGILLVIGCASVAGLLLERGAARANEMATRAALGAARIRLVRQLLTENLVLAAMAAVCGSLLAWLGIAWLNATVLDHATSTARLDARVLAFTAMLGLLTVLLAGLAPAIQISRPRARRQRLRAALIVGEIALALVSVAASATLIQDIWHEVHVPVGYHADGVIAAAVDVAGPGYETAAARTGFASRLLAAAAALPAVRNAALVSPPGMQYDQPSVTVRGAQPKLDTTVKVWAVSPGYFSALQVGRQAGRDFQPSDGAGATPVAIVSQTAARRLFPGVPTAMGQYLRIVRQGEPVEWRQVVGVVGDVSVYEGESPGERVNVYEPLAQAGAWTGVGILLRSARGAPDATPALREAATRLDPALPVYAVHKVAGTGAQDHGGDEYFAELLGLLVGLALLIAAVGLYGVVAYAAARRRREVAIRIAVGATRARVIHLLAADGLSLALIGVAAGLLFAWLDSYVLANLFAGIPTRGVALFAVPSAVLLATAVTASYLPARRAAGTHPMSVLKEQ